jgi:drug/metabolite transporter (DMT)-like permease
MPDDEDGRTANIWMIYALTTVVCWGIYGILLHTGRLGFQDPDNGLYKAFLWVGVAYFLVAVLAPIGLLVVNGADWHMPGKGLWWSLLAGVAGAIGALGVLLAFGAKGHPAVVMSIIFAGAPIVNAIVAFAIHPPSGGFGSLRWQFVAGILLAAVGGMMVTLYKPPPGGAKAATKPAAVQPGAQPGGQPADEPADRPPGK